jgi:hypothetical protein
MSDEFQFAGIDYNSRQIPLTLTPLLYRGGGGCDMRKFWGKLEEREFCSQAVQRFSLVVTLFRVLSNIISMGGSFATLKLQVNCLRSFYDFADSRYLEPTMKNVVGVYQSWVRELYKRSVASGQKDISEADYGRASGLASLLGEATGLGRDSFVKTSKLRAPRKSTKALGAKVDRQDLEKTKNFVDVLIDIIRSLSSKACFSKLPLSIKLRNGVETDHYAALNQHAASMPPTAPQLHDISTAVRYPLFNLRVEAEMMLFISQTSMNLGDTAKLKMQNFRYKSDGAFTQVYGYKGRKKGEVLFTIYKEYKPFFTDYLKFRECIGLDEHTELIFGKVCQPGHVLSKNPNPRSLLGFLKRMGLSHVPASEFRRTRQNWLARKMGDPQVAAEMGQHDLQTYAKSYSRPHHQTAALEFTRFYKSLDVSRTASLDGACDGDEPQLIKTAHKTLDKPDCFNPALCVYCLNYKGIRSYDYIWSLITYAKLKRYEEFCNKCSIGETNDIVSRIEDIAKQFKAENKTCFGWSVKAEKQVAFGNHHPRWAGFFDIIGLRLV